MTIMGIDPGIANIGVGVVKNGGKTYALINHQTIKTTPEQVHQERLNFIFIALSKLIDEFKPEILVMESLFFAVNARSAMTVGKAMGAISLAASTNGIEVVEYTPLQIKKYLCGYGRAKKPEVQEMVRKLLKLELVPKPQHAADALAAALTYFEMKSTKTAKTNK